MSLLEIVLEQRTSDNQRGATASVGVDAPYTRQGPSEEGWTLGREGSLKPAVAVDSSSLFWEITTTSPF